MWTQLGRGWKLYLYHDKRRDIWWNIARGWAQGIFQGLKLYFTLYPNSSYNADNINLYQTISDYTRLYHNISNYIRLSDYIILYHTISHYQIILDYIWLYQTISDYIRLYQTISDYIRLYQTISYYIKLYQTIRLYHTISDYIRLYQTISSESFPAPSSAPSPACSHEWKQVSKTLAHPVSSPTCLRVWAPTLPGHIA